MSRTAVMGAGAPALVLASILWGTTGTAASFFPDTVSPLAIGASTMGVGGLLLFVTSARMSVAALRDRAVRTWVLVGAIGVVIYPLAFYLSMDLAGIAIGNVVSLGTGPVFAALLEWVFERQRLSRRWLACTVMAIIGVVLLAFGGHGAGPAPSESVVPGILSGIVAGFAYALYTYASSRAIRAGAPSRGAMGSMFGVGALVLVPVLLALGAPLLQTGLTIGIAAYLALGPMFVAYLLFGIGMRTLSSSTATTITLLEPFVATILAVVVVGERLDPLGWIGLALILGAITFLTTAGLPGRRQRPL
ncbi:DME family drug/metabolite transporter [Microbacteriaceae bacterium SG_E_30_P1]|uniref:DME family drug/metabolite transporter n=1 Tax=Antiquaquibacter oligotrophicus TaxID=2880260 RepID=A0ABT6KMX3_9MICO|nr:EamA family transporter [Antiquaquibacter oligotrophicus]MDH6181090.1 DME family drug/metabolite transporter [Antiquaquibacter oligotrophicus]UDF13212.1 DMT family transporter [Antiquaquibacter oligotrophicus]